MQRHKARLNPDDYGIARRRMVEVLKRRGIVEPNLLRAMSLVPRHFFVDEAQAAQAYTDMALPIGYGQTISQPYMVALMIQTVELKASDRVLEIGSGSGYQTAVLAALAAEVFAVERLERLYLKGQANLGRLSFDNIELKLDDGTLGWPQKAPFDVIVVAAGGPRLPKPLVEQLAPGGRLIIPVGESSLSQKLTLVTKDAEGQATRQIVGDCRFVDLVGRHGW